MPTQDDREKARTLLLDFSPYPDPILTDRIAVALEEERESAAKIAEAHNDAHPNGGDYKNCGLAIATAIRETGEKR